jgi:hypothetical protein
MTPSFETAELADPLRFSSKEEASKFQKSRRAMLNNIRTRNARDCCSDPKGTPREVE